MLVGQLQSCTTPFTRPLKHQCSMVQQLLQLQLQACHNVALMMPCCVQVQPPEAATGAIAAKRISGLDADGNRPLLVPDS